MKNIQIFGGGTVAHITSHFAVSAPAYGKTARKLAQLCADRFNPWENGKLKGTMSIVENYTKMAGGDLETNEDVAKRIEELKKDLNTKIVFFNCALVDWNPENAFYSATSFHNFGKYEQRLDTRKFPEVAINFKPAKKIVSNIRTGRKDIFLVGFKTTCGASKQKMYEKGLRLCKEGSCNLVLVNDTKTRWNQIITPEEAVYHETDNREEILQQLVDMTWYRSQLTFTQSTVVDGKPVSWNDERIPESLRKVVNYAIKANAYKPFQGKTVGHFAIKLSDTEFLTSIRKSNFNDLDKIGMVYVKTNGPDSVLAYGAKPSVGGQSQRTVFKDHPGFDCIFHAHVPLKENHPDNIPIRSQREIECGAHECGKSTSEGLAEFEGGKIKAVMLDRHGPNIVFNKNTDPQLVINFIERNFDLSKKTGGYQI